MESKTKTYHLHAITKSLLLHVSPGILTTIAFFLIRSLIDTTKYPPLLAFLLAVVLVDIPFQVLIMLLEGRKISGQLSLKGLFPYQQKLKWKTFILIFVIVFIGVYLLMMLVSPVNDWIAVNAFSWLPSWLLLEEQTQYLAYSRTVLLVLFTIQLIVTGVALPLVEELYFRGFLLPRISGPAWLTPLIGGLFFGFYHIWQPNNFLTVFLLGIVLSYIVWWKKDLRLSIGLHIFANLISRIMFLLVAVSL